MSGRTQSRRYPLARATIARLIPVLPLVGSRMVLSGDRSPLSSAAPIIYSAMRSFTLPVGFWPSSLAYISTPDFGEKRARRTSGVLPTASRIEAKDIRELLLPRRAFQIFDQRGHVSLVVLTAH